MSRFLTVLSKKVVKALGPQHQRYSHKLIFVVLSTKKRLPVQEKPRKHAPHPVTDSQSTKAPWVDVGSNYKHDLATENPVAANKRSTH